MTQKKIVTKHTVGKRKASSRSKRKVSRSNKQVFRRLWFVPLYGASLTEGWPRTILAETLDDGFVWARCLWPGANGWRYLGKQDPKDPERCIPEKLNTDDQVVVMVPRKKEKKQ